MSSIPSAISSGVATPSPLPSRRQAWAQHRREAFRLIAARADWVPVLVFASILMPPEARIDFAGFQLYPYRLALILAIPSIILRIAKEPVRFGLADLLVIGSGVMMLMATSLHYPLDVALKTGGAVTLDHVLAYLFGRSFFRTSLDVRRFLYRIAPLLLGVALVMVAESVSHRYLFRPAVSAITDTRPMRR